MVLQVFRVFLAGALVFWAVGLGPLCWILRDGLGPRSVDSHGVNAVVRFLFTFYWGPVLAALAMLCLLCHRLIRAREDARIDESPDEAL